MREYELMVILDPSIDERTVAPQMEKYLEQVTANGGSVQKVDPRNCAGNQPLDDSERVHPAHEAPASGRPLTFARLSNHLIQPTKETQWLEKPSLRSLAI